MIEGLFDRKHVQTFETNKNDLSNTIINGIEVTSSSQQNKLRTSPFYIKEKIPSITIYFCSTIKKYSDEPKGKWMERHLFSNLYSTPHLTFTKWKRIIFLPMKASRDPCYIPEWVDKGDHFMQVNSTKTLSVHPCRHILCYKILL